MVYELHYSLAWFWKDLLILGSSTCYWFRVYTTGHLMQMHNYEVVPESSRSPVETLSIRNWLKTPSPILNLLSICMQGLLLSKAKCLKNCTLPVTTILKKSSCGTILYSDKSSGITKRREVTILCLELNIVLHCFFPAASTYKPHDTVHK